MSTKTFDYNEFLVERYGRDIINQLFDLIDKHGKKCCHNFMDNYRIAATDDPNALFEYEKVANQGCCGYEDFEINIHTEPNDILKNLIFETKPPRIFKLGYNFGH